jgi:hypothetical protein
MMRFLLFAVVGNFGLERRYSSASPAAGTHRSDGDRREIRVKDLLTGESKTSSLEVF